MFSKYYSVEDSRKLNPLESFHLYSSNHAYRYAWSVCLSWAISWLVYFSAMPAKRYTVCCLKRDTQYSFQCQAMCIIVLKNIYSKTHEPNLKKNIGWHVIDLVANKRLQWGKNLFKCFEIALSMSPMDYHLPCRNKDLWSSKYAIQFP